MSPREADWREGWRRLSQSGLTAALPLAEPTLRSRDIIIGRYEAKMFRTAKERKFAGPPTPILLCCSFLMHQAGNFLSFCPRPVPVAGEIFEWHCRQTPPHPHLCINNLSICGIPCRPCISAILCVICEGGGEMRRPCAMSPFPRQSPASARPLLGFLRRRTTTSC